MPEDFMEIFKDEIDKSKLDFAVLGTSILWVGEDDEGNIGVSRINPCDVELEKCQKQ